MNSKNGFTLAEVLIVIGIIGIIANMTIPTLVKDTQNKALKVTWKKAYSVLSQATLMVLNENAGTLANLCTNSDCIRDVYSEYLPTIKKCNDGTSGCFFAWGEPWYYMSKATVGGWGSDSGAILRDGVVVNYAYFNPNCNSWANECGNIYVDVNGSKKPNTIGKDIFKIHIQSNGISPYGSSSDGLEADCVTSPPSGNGFGCAAKYLMGD